MVSSQVIRGCIEQLRAITRIEFCVQDTAGNMVAQTEGAETPDRNMVTGFALSAIDSQIVGSSYYLKVMDDEELAFILIARNLTAIISSRTFFSTTFSLWISITAPRSFTSRTACAERS